MTDHVCGLMGFGRGLDGIHDTCPACDEREGRYRATRAPMPDDSLKHYGLHDGPTNRLPSPRGQTHYEGCERTAVDALDRARAELAQIIGLTKEPAGYWERDDMLTALRTIRNRAYAFLAARAQP